MISFARKNAIAICCDEAASPCMYLSTFCYKLNAPLVRPQKLFIVKSYNLQCQQTDARRYELTMYVVKTIAETCKFNISFINGRLHWLLMGCHTFDDLGTGWVIFRKRDKRKSSTLLLR